MAWQLDKAHTQIAFAVKHMMVSTVRGQFKNFSGTVELDEQHPERSRVEVMIDPTSIDTGDERRDGHLRTADFFEVEKHPEIRFVSTHVERASDDEYRVTGALSMRGVTRPVTLDVTLEGQSRDMQGQRRAGFSLHGAINRKDYGLTWNVALEQGGVLVGDKVQLVIDAEVFEPAQVSASV
ncbi:MAG TPA: YceI family protein [Ktedonobacterales bacterium]|nr:YceI family protein [Ktedonobacterales bacterium]